MYTNEELASKVGQQENSIMQLYKQNENFIYYIYNKYCSSDFNHKDLDDFKQVAYFALCKAVDVYNQKKEYKFLSYYGRCLLQEFYRLKLNMWYPMKLSQDVYKKLMTKEISLAVTDLESVEISVNEQYAYYDYYLKLTVWSIVHTELTEKNAYVITRRFLYKDTLQQIADVLNIGCERVRKRELNSLKKLRRNKKLRELAYDYFYIKG